MFEKIDLSLAEGETHSSLFVVYEHHRVGGIYCVLPP